LDGQASPAALTVCRLLDGQNFMTGFLVRLQSLQRRWTLLLPLACPWVAAAATIWQDWPLPLSVEARPAPVSLPEGWQVRAQAEPCRLQSLTVFDGLPQEQAALVPETDQTLPGGRGLLSWTLTPASAAGTWVALAYSCKTLVLSRPLPASATGFRVRYDRRVRPDGLPRILGAEIRVEAEPAAGVPR
tara:strand:- start:257 stop:820 length:564 start_codon:yes stop_codon:yes gene_type:complete